MDRAKRSTKSKLHSIRLDGAGEHISNILKMLHKIEGISIEFSPAYTSQSNGRAKRLKTDERNVYSRL